MCCLFIDQFVYLVLGLHVFVHYRGEGELSLCCSHHQKKQNVDLNLEYSDLLSVNIFEIQPKPQYLFCLHISEQTGFSSFKTPETLILTWDINKAGSSIKMSQRNLCSTLYFLKVYLLTSLLSLLFIYLLYLSIYLFTIYYDMHCTDI